MKKKIMILGGSELQLPGILEAKKMGLQVIVCDYYEKEKCVGKQVDGVIGELISTYDKHAVLEAAKKHNIDAIITLCTDYPMRVVGYVAQTLGLPGISEEIAINATDKGKMRSCLKANNVPSPKFSIVHSKSECIAEAKKIGKRCVVKAVDNSGSRGVVLVDDAYDENKVGDAFDYCKGYSRSGDILLEEYMIGREVCVETLNFGGNCYPIQITDQLEKNPPFFTDAGYSQPAIFDKNMIEQIKNVAIAANLALNNHTGSSCTEIIVTEEGPKVVEIGPRLAGDYMTTHLVPLSTGVNMVEGIIKIALGEKPNIEPQFHRGACIRYYMEPVEGHIKEICGIDDAKAVNGVVNVSLMKNVGDEAVPLRSSNDRIGFVMAHGETAEEAVNICEIALKKIHVITE